MGSIIKAGYFACLCDWKFQWASSTNAFVSYLHVNFILKVWINSSGTTAVFTKLSS